MPIEPPVYWDYMMRYGYFGRVILTEDAALKAWARAELREGMQWLADEYRYEAREMMRADDDGMR